MNDNRDNNSTTGNEDRVGARGNRPRRRARKPLKLDTTVPSPCRSICRFDGQPYCIGCYRNVDEIREWMLMTREQKLAVLANLEQRKKAAKNDKS